MHTARMLFSTLPLGLAGIYFDVAFSKGGIMASTLKKIIDWSKTLPEWQSDAIRRLLTQDELSPSDKAELLAMLKDKHGLGDPAKPIPKPRTLQHGEVSGAPAAATSIVLKSIDAISNVNALPDDSSIPFGHSGLTLIYGENGSGKSGYARVLKRACRARDKKERIHPNVFCPAPSGPAEATFKIIANGSNQDITWIDGGLDSGLLANICVFDSKCARIIIDGNNEAHYLPFGAQVFEELVSLLKDLRSVLQTEKPSTVLPEWPDIPPETKAGQFVSQLSVNSKLDTVGSWIDSDEQLLAEATKRLVQAELEDPAKAAQRLRNFADRVKLLAADLEKVEKNASAAAEDKIRKCVSALITARQALAVAAQSSLTDEPLPEVGGEVWQLLYQAARDYSIHVAYPSLEFPNTDEGSRCVLCMQPLSEEAKTRLLRFRDYMEQTAKKNVEALVGQLSDFARNLSALNMALEENYKDVLDELRASSGDLVGKIEQYSKDMRPRVDGLLEITKDEQLKSLSATSSMAAKDLLDVADGTIAKANKVEKIAKPEDLAKLRVGKKELDARKLLWSKRKDIESYMKQLNTAAKYDQCIGETDFRNITTTGKTIIKEALTPELCKALQDELIALNATHLPLNLRATASEGETHHKLELQTDRPTGKLSLTEILSEGEQCVVGIAGFLAELKTAAHTCPIVFDDPVSSLDHRYREKIAERLIQKATTHQVIVFTHDLSFLLDLQSKAGAFGIDSFGKKFGGVAFSAMAARRDNGVVGRLRDGLPWHAQSVEERLKVLTLELDAFKNLFETDQTAYNEHAAALYGHLRETWEAFVEEIMFCKAVVRHRPDIQTLRLQSVTVTTSDCIAVYIGMTKCSIWMSGHDKSKPLGANRPTPTEIKTDIKALQDIKRDMKARQKQASQAHEKALSPATSPIG